MARKLILMLSTEGKSRELIKAEALAALDKFTQATDEVQGHARPGVNAPPEGTQKPV